MKVAVILDFFKEFDVIEEYDYLIGVDRGAFNAISNGIKLDFAIGDFDSVSQVELETLKELTKVKILNPIKDETDTLEAVKYAYIISDDVTILGGIQGRRIEHFIANICLFNSFPNLKIRDDNSLIYVKNNSFKLDKGGYHYVSFFALDDVTNLCLNGFKYNLDNYHLKTYDSLGISNEPISQPMVSFTKGRLLVIQTKLDN